MVPFAKIHKSFLLRQVFGRKMVFVAFESCCRKYLRKNLGYFLDLAEKRCTFVPESRSKRVSKLSFFIFELLVR